MMQAAVFPRVFAEARNSEMTIIGVEPGTEIRIISKIYPEVCQHRSVTENGMLAIALPFAGEYYIDIMPDGPGYGRRFSVFAVGPMLQGVLPFQGDMHIHTTYSDGMKEPGRMVNAGRALGLDFLAITDHDNYDASVEAKIYADSTGYNMLVMHGEEVTLPVSGHMLSIGAGSPMHLKQMNPAELAEAVRQTAEAMEPIEGGVTAEEYAPIKWAAETIRSKGGMPILCHPFWVMEKTGYFHLRRNVLRHALLDGLTDAVEIPGDTLPEDTHLGLSFYNGLPWRGRKMPLVANSDTHDDNHTFGHRWQTVFCRELAQESVLGAVKDGMSVACEKRPGTPLHIHGDFELAEYAYFLHREYFPAKDRFAALEAESITAGNFKGNVITESAEYTESFFSENVKPRITRSESYSKTF